MSKNEIQLIARFKDFASSALRRFAGEVERTAQTQTRAISQAEKQRRYSQMAYERLGIRSEQKIRQEILSTQRSYDYLARSGTLSQRELARAAEASRNRIRQLNNELGIGVQQASRWRGIGRGVMIGGGMAMAGAQQVQAVLEPKMDRIVDYETLMLRNASLLDETDTYAGRVAAEKRARNMIDEASRHGGSRDDLAAMQAALLAKGTLTPEQVQAAMNGGAKAMTASYFELDAKSAADAQAALLDFGMTAENLSDGLGKMFLGGKLGSFEVADMARHFKSQLSAAGSNGFKGERDVAYIIAMNQNAAAISGSPDEAANNVRQYLEAANNPQVKRALAEALKIDVSEVEKRYTEGLANNKNPSEVFDSMMQEILTKSDEWRRLQTQMLSAQDDAQRQAVMQKQEQFLEGSVVGKILTDQQRRYGYLALTSNRDQFERNFSAIQTADRTAMDLDFQRAQESNRFKQIQAENAKAGNDERAYTGVTNARGSYHQWLSDFSRENPRAGEAISMAGDAKEVITGMLPFIAGSYVFSKLGGLLGGGGAAAGAGGAGSAGAATQTAATSSRLMAGGGLGAGGGAMTAMAAAGLAAPFAWYGVTRWAGQRDKYAERAEGLRGFSAWLREWLPNFDGDKQGEALRRRAELGGEHATNYANYLRERGQSPLDSPELAQSMQQMQQSAQTYQQAGEVYAQSVVDNNTAATQLVTAAGQMQTAAALMQAAAGKPVPVTVTVQNGNIAAYINQAAARDNKRN